MHARFVTPWQRGEGVELGERTFEPAKAELRILEGRELRPDELAMGRGWANAERNASDVTERFLTGGATEAAAAPVAPAVEAFKEDVLSLCAGGRVGLHQVVWLASDRFPGARVSDRLALAERAVWELLHHGRIRLLDAGGELDRSRWEPVLLAWDTWAGGRGPAILLERR